MKSRTVWMLSSYSLAFLLVAGASAQEWTSARPDGHAPLGVMGDHTHSRGEVMLSYRFMRMSMDGNRMDTGPVTPAEVLADFMVTPLRMSMTMHMVGLMVAPSDRLTLMATASYVRLEMDHRTRMGGEFTTTASGVGDIKVSGLLELFNRNRQALHLNLGVSVPTDSIEMADVTPASAPDEAILPYPMQIGSGTTDLLPGVTYLGQVDRWSWGAQARATIRMGENDRSYRLGKREPPGSRYG